MVEEHVEHFGLRLNKQEVVECLQETTLKGGVECKNTFSVLKSCGRDIFIIIKVLSHVDEFDFGAQL